MRTVKAVKSKYAGGVPNHYDLKINGKNYGVICHPAKNPLLRHLSLQELAEQQADRILNS